VEEPQTDKTEEETKFLEDDITKNSGARWKHELFTKGCRGGKETPVDFLTEA